MSAFEVAISRSRDEAIIEKIAAEILTPLKTGKVTSADHRVLYGHMLDALPSSVALAKSVPAGLTVLVGKEPNEAALTALISTFSRHLATGLKGDILIEPSVTDAVNKGLVDKRPAVRRIWFTKIGAMIWDTPGEPSPVFREFCQGIASKLLDVFTETTAKSKSLDLEGIPNIKGKMVV